MCQAHFEVCRPLPVCRLVWAGRAPRAGCRSCPGHCTHGAPKLWRPRLRSRAGAPFFRPGSDATLNWARPHFGAALLLSCVGMRLLRLCGRRAKLSRIRQCQNRRPRRDRSARGWMLGQTFWQVSASNHDMILDEFRRICSANRIEKIRSINEAEILKPSSQFRSTGIRYLHSNFIKHGRLYRQPTSGHAVKREIVVVRILHIHIAIFKRPQIQVHTLYKPNGLKKIMPDL